MPHRFFRSALLGLVLAGGFMAASPAHAATFTVTNASDADDGACTAADTDNGCSLREAINAANTAAGDDTIDFDASVTGTIVLNDSLPAVSTNIDITGPGARFLYIDGDDFSQILTVTATSNISGLSFVGGYSDIPVARTGGQGGGGAVSVVGGNLTVDGCLFLLNYAENEGGALNNYGTTIVRNSAFIGNASPFGGAINNYTGKGFAGDLTLENVTMTGNFSSQGGAIMNDGILTVNTSTITDNEANYGGGIADVASTTCNNSIIADNFADYVGDDFLNGTFGGSFNFVGGDPMFDPAGLADNGGQTPTIGLLPSSPCINAGDPAYVGATYDQRGNPFDRVKQGQVDIGAFEVQGPRLTARDFGFAEGSISHVVNFGVTLSAPSASTISIDYTTADDTAIDGVDYTATSGNLTFTPGQTSKLIPITILGNTTDEDDRDFLLTFTQAGAPAAELGDASAYVIIKDDDLAPRVSIAAANVSEGNAGTTNLDFAVSLSAASGKYVSVDVVSDTGTITPAATPGDDYIPLSTTVTFAPGETLKYATVLVNGDNAVEPDEHLRVNLQNAANTYYKAPSNTADGIINNDDILVLPTLSAGDRSITETEASRNVTFTVTLSAPYASPVTVHYFTSNGTAVAGQDYNAASGTLTFAAGETTKNLTLVILGDTIDEDDETFYLNLDTPTNATIVDNQAIGTIVDNDATPSLTINNVSLIEGDTDTTAFTFTVTLTGATARNVTVVAQTAASSAPTATGGVDYNIVAPQTLTFLPGETTKTVTVLVNGDTAVEANEKFVVRLSSAVNATIKTSFGVGTILNDDVASSSFRLF